MVKISNNILNIVSVKVYCLETGMFLGDSLALLPNDEDGPHPRSITLLSRRRHEIVLLVLNRDVVDQQGTIYIDLYDPEKWETYR